MEYNEKLLMRSFVLSTFLYERAGQRLSTTSAGEPLYQVPDMRSTVIRGAKAWDEHHVWHELVGGGTQSWRG
jgi:hypothetical protein